MMDENLLTSNKYHMICTPTRCIDLCEGILAARQKLRREHPGHASHFSKRPVFVWEPMEDSCRPSEMAMFLEAFDHVDVFSPNERELLGLCDMETRPGAELDSETVKRACDKLLANAGSRAVVARCGPHGCIVAQSNRYLTIPAYHQPQRDPNNPGVLRPAELIVDVTGGGNAFLGGFCAALGSQSDVTGLSRYEAAAFYGNIAASYAIEQVGVPRLMASGDEELWNGTSPFARLEDLFQRFQRGSI